MSAVASFHYAYSWANQYAHYPVEGPPGISYFAGHLPEYAKPVDCLLWRDETGKVRGILNHYPCDMGPERKGSVNVFVNPRFQRRGIAAALVAEAQRRWSIDWAAQKYTESGAALVNALAARGTLASGGRS